MERPDRNASAEATRRGAAAALGLAVHTGWAHAVVVCARERGLEVLHRERLALWDPSNRGEAHGYHRAAEVPPEQAERVIAEAREIAGRAAASSFARIAGEVERRGRRLVAARVVDKARRPLPPLAKVLASHPLLHAAEGALFRSVALSAAASLVGDAAEVDVAELPALAAGAAGVPAREIAALLARAGKEAGSPWGKEQRDCALAAWLALLERGTGAR